MKFLISVSTLFFAVMISFCNCNKKKPPTPINDIIDPMPNVGLKFVKNTILIGAPVEADRGSETYLNIAKTELNTSECLWYPAWGGWLGEKTYNFKVFSENVNWAKANGITPTMHMIVGPDSYMPEWLVKGSWQNNQLDSLLRQTIFALMDTNDNKSKVEIWNVANELFDDDGTYRTNILWRQLGWEADKSALTGSDKINMQHPVFIRKAFAYCREKTNKKLEIRDFNIESDDPNTQNYRKNKALFQLVKHMKNEQIPIDAIGIQGHLTIGKNSWIFENNMLRETVKKYKSLGVEVYITELDNRTDQQTWNAQLAEQQKQDYYNYIKQAVEGGATRISFWGIQDDFDPYWLLGEYPLLWDKNFNKKPAYAGAKAGLKEAK